MISQNNGWFDRYTTDVSIVQSYSYVNRKVWYHQISIPNNLGFIVADLIKIPVYLTFIENAMSSISPNFTFH